MMADLGNFEAKFENCLTDQDGSLVLSFRVPKAEAYTARQIVGSIRIAAQNGKERLKITVNLWKEARSLNANSYFHVLVGKIAQKMQISVEEAKKMMVIEYGAPATESGDQVIVAIPKAAEITDYYPYAKWIADFTAKNGKPYSQYVLFKQTHTMDSKEMARLIDGVVYEAKELGIETRTPDQIAQMIDKWESK